MGGVPGFWRRTVEHAKRQTAYAIRMDGLRAPRAPRSLIQFDKPDKVNHIKIMSDKAIGGFSRAEMVFEPGTIPAMDLSKNTYPDTLSDDGSPPHAVFRGSISTELSQNRQDVQRSGYAGWRTKDLGYSLFGAVLWDLGAYGYVALRVKSDGRKYFVNFQTESLIRTDLHQHILPARTPGQWETITIPFSSFVRTNFGMVVEPQSEMGRMKVRSVGISLTDRIQGPFELCIADVYATNVSGRQLDRRDSGFDIADMDEEESPPGIMDDVRPKRKPGEPERILI